MAKKTKTYILEQGLHARVEGDGLNHIYRSGDTIDLTREEAAGLADRIRDPNAAPPPEDDEEEDEEPVATVTEAKTTAVEPKKAGPAPEDLTVEKLTPMIEKATSVDEVKALREQEVAGKNRKGVLDAADARIAELTNKEGS